jgi:phospholipid/cholesterol/gamma-HCH transport system substrate-binding protein
MTRGKEVMVGVVIVLGTIIAVVGSLWLKDASFGRGTQQVDAVFKEVGQLMVGNAVKLRGVTIGRVEDIRVVPDGRAVRVRMSYRDDVQLPEDPVALLAPENMFGDWQAEILERSESFFQFEYHDSREDGVIPGYALPDFSRLTAAADQISANLGQLTDRVEEAFTEETARNLSEAIDNIQNVSEHLRKLVEAQAGAVSDLATEFEASAAELRQAAEAAHLTFERAEELLGAPTTDSMMLDARAAMANLKTLSDELTVTTRGAQGFIEKADSTFTRLDRLTARVEAGEGGLGRIVSDTALVAEAQEVLSRLSFLLRDLQENPQKYVRISIF